MYKWRVTFYLNNGSIISVLHDSDSVDSKNVVREILLSKQPNTVYWFEAFSEDKKKHVVVRIENVSCMEVEAIQNEERKNDEEKHT